MEIRFSGYLERGLSEGAEKGGPEWSEAANSDLSG
jgi:hypothetical protein